MTPQRRQAQTESKYSVIRLRIAASGIGPWPAPRLSRMCSALAVPGMAQVTAGWLTIHLRKYCAQLAMPSSAAHGGSGFSLVGRKSAAPGEWRVVVHTPIVFFGTVNN